MSDHRLILEHIKADRLSLADHLLRPLIDSQQINPQTIYLSGLLCERRGNIDEAIRLFQQVIELAPGFANVRLDLAKAWYAKEQFDLTIQSCLHAISILPTFHSARFLLAQTYNQMSQFDEAVEQFQILVNYKPDHAEALAGLAEAMKSCHEFRNAEQAIAYLDKAITLDPKNAKYWLTRAQLEQFLSDYERAESSCRRAIELDESLYGARFLCATLQYEQGRFEQSSVVLTELIEHVKRNRSISSKLQHKIVISAYSQIANILRGKTSSETVEEIQQMMSEPRSEELHRTVLSVALAQVYDSRKEYNAACKLLTSIDGKPRIDPAPQYNPQMERSHVDGLIQQWSSEFHATLQSFGNPTQRPVFILGLPRSGTTLTEQILASHPQVHGAGELFMVPREFQRLPRRMNLNQLPVDCIGHLDQSILQSISNDMMAELHAINSNALCVSDKLPDNYHHVGLITALFPNATVIHCQRDVRDIAVSLFLNNFESLHWTNDIKHIADRISDYWRIMHHWRSIPSIKMMEIDYEDLVSDVESQARRLIDSIGLKWDDACLEYTKSNRPITTCSFSQARKPAHTKSIAKWKHYEELLQPLLEQLGQNQSVGYAA